MNKLVFFAAALLLAPLPAAGQQAAPAPQAAPQTQGAPSSAMENPASTSEHGQRAEDLLDRIAESGLKDRLAAAIERVEDACGEDIEEYCSDVTPGGGRIAASCTPTPTC